jgi:pimeloyl-ACP methyl ester carboxylesterase
MIASTGPTSRIFYSQRMRLHYADWGNADAPPLLLVHGGRDHCRNWDWVAERLRQDWHIIAPDLRGHGDSQWSASGSYGMPGFIYDLAQLIHQLKLAPVTIVAHSLGGGIATRYAGIYPENVKRLVSIEGLGPSPKMLAERESRTLAERMRRWIEDQRGLAGRLPRRYPTLEDAFQRMREENKHLSEAQARHLTVHGINQNEDGTFSWKFDNYVRAFPPYDLAQGEVEKLWASITSPTLLVYGKESWASDPRSDGRAAHLKTAEIRVFERAGHWVHHDRLDDFLALIRPFLAGQPLPQIAGVG